MKPIIIDTEIGLPDVKELVTVSLESKGVSFVAFAIELFLGTNPIRSIAKHASEKDIGRKFPVADALTMRGLGFDCGGVVGSAVPDKIELHCEFSIDDQTFLSKMAVIELRGNNVSREFHLRCTFK